MRGIHLDALTHFCFQIVSARAEFMARIIGSTDPLLHFSVYAWLLARNLQEMLLKIDSEHLETYLRAHEQLDLLWKVCSLSPLSPLPRSSHGSLRRSCTPTTSA